MRGRKKQNEKVQYDYKDADTYFIINDGDVDIKPLRLSLPSPPKLKFIDGYGLPPEEQYFRPLEIPKKLIELQRRAFNQCKKNYEVNKQLVVTWDRVIDMYWTMFDEQRDDMPEEVLFIKHVHWYRNNGYWFFNDGKPTWLPPDYFDFLNFYRIAENGGELPEYRDEDRKKYCFRHYLEHATETFADLDDNGMAVKGVDGKYKMIDIGSRVFFGDLEPKFRRRGSTHQGCHKVKKGCETTFGSYGTIISMEGDNAEKHYYKKLLPAFERYPYFLICKNDATVGRFPLKIRYRARTSMYDVYSMDSMIDFTDSADEKKNDGDKLFYSLMDEEGKADRVDVLERWNVNKLAQSTGSGSKIIGYSQHPSTVEQMEEGGLAYMKMAQLSNFYQRIPGKGQTNSGLARIFFPAYKGLENFIDRFGMSVIDKPTERQKRLRPDALFARLDMGALEYLLNERDSLLKRGTPEAMESYRSLRRKMPIQYAECWLGSSGDMGWDLEKVDRRLVELKRKDNIRVGNFEWADDIPDSKVVFVEDKNGRFEVSRLLPDTLSNKKTKEPVYIAKKRKTEYQHAPLFTNRFTLGADPIRFSNKSDAKLRDNKSRQSDGGIAVFWERDTEIDKDDNPKEWKSSKFVVSYRYRPASTFEYNEDVLKVAVYYGATVYMERNVENLWEHFLDRGYGGYLQYDINPGTGRYNDKPGCYMDNAIKDEGFRWVKNYINKRCHMEDFASFLKEIKRMQGPEHMTYNDRFTAHMIAGLGSWRKMGNEYYNPKKTEKQSEGYSIRSAVKWLRG